MGFFEEIEKKKKHAKYMREWYKNKETPEQKKERFRRAKEYRERPEYYVKRKEYDSKYIDTHYDVRKKSCVDWNKRNPEKHRQTVRTYVKKHPDRILKAALEAQEKLGAMMNMTGMQWRNMCIRWTKAVKKAYPTCVCCDKPSYQAHHILYKVNYPKLQFNVNNGVSLCKEHHHEVHSFDRKVGNY